MSNSFLIAQAVSGIGGRLGPINILDGVPEVFITEATPTYRFIARMQRFLVEQVAPLVGGRKSLKEMVIGHAYADHIKSGDIPATCTGRAFRLVINTELSDAAKAKCEQLRRNKDRKRSAKSRGVADPADQEADITHVNFDDTILGAVSNNSSLDWKIVVTQACKTLTIEEQEIIYWTYVEEESIRDVAERLHMAKSTVAGIKARAERKVKAIINDARLD